MKNQTSKKTSNESFEDWLKQNKPLFEPLTSILVLLCVLSAAVSIVLCIWFSWWWKMLLISVLSYGVSVAIHQTIGRHYVRQWKQSSKTINQMFSKYFPFEDCPECGDALIVKTNCDPADDTDDGMFFSDGDEVFCDDPNCNFKSALSVDEESGEMWVQD